MKNHEIVHVSVGRCSPVMRRYAAPVTALIAQTGFTVHFPDHESEFLSIEEQLTALTDHTSDCVLIPGDLVPSALPERTFLAAVLPRRSTRLCLVTPLGSFHPTPGDPIGLPSKAVVAVPSDGQRVQLLALNPDLTIIDRMPPTGTLGSAIGNGTLDAVLISPDEIDLHDLAGLALVNLRPEIMLPPPGSGTTAIVAREDDPIEQTLVTLNDFDTYRCVVAERALAQALEWPTALACLATTETGGGIRLQATMAGRASDPRSALARVGASAPTPEAAANLCFFAFMEGMKDD